MKKLKIEWRYYDKKGETCTRCNNTGDNIKTAIESISSDQQFKNIDIDYSEKKLGAGKMPESNTVIINGQKLEDILNARASENYCHLCSCLAGKGTNCRTVLYGGKVYEDLSVAIIIAAIKQSVKS